MTRTTPLSKYWAAAAVSILALSGAGATAASAQSNEAVVVIEMPGLYPEGMDYDTGNDRYIAGSFVSGNLVSVTKDGAVTPFGKAGSNVTGIEIDEERGRVLAAVMALPNGQAQLSIHDIDSGEQTSLVDLGGLLSDDAVLFANDIAVGPDGTAYVTNTGAGVIFAVGTDGEASVFAQNSAFDAVVEGSRSSGLNGIVSVGDALLVGHTPTGQMWRVPLDNPSAATIVTTPSPLPGIDGMVLSADGTQLAVVSGGASTALVLRSPDGWMSAGPAGVFQTGPGFPTAIAAVDGGFEISYSHLDTLASQSDTSFEIAIAEFAAPTTETNTTTTDAAELAHTGPGQSEALVALGAMLVASGLVVTWSSRRMPALGGQ